MAVSKGVEQGSPTPTTGSTASVRNLTQPSNAMSGIGNAIGSLAVKLGEEYKDKSLGADIANAREEIGRIQLNGNQIQATLRRRQLTNNLLKKYGAKQLSTIRSGLETMETFKTSVVGGMKIKTDKDGNIVQSSVADPMEMGSERDKAALTKASVYFPRTSDIATGLIERLSKEGNVNPELGDTILNASKVWQRIPGQIEDLTTKLRADMRNASSVDELQNSMENRRTTIMGLVQNGLEEFQSSAMGRLIGNRDLALVDERAVNDMGQSYILDTLDLMSEQGIFTLLKIDRAELRTSMQGVLAKTVEHYTAVNRGDLVRMELTKKGLQLENEISGMKILREWRTENPDIYAMATKAEYFKPAVELAETYANITIAGPQLRDGSAKQAVKRLTDGMVSIMQNVKLAAAELPRTMSTRADVRAFRTMAEDAIRTRDPGRIYIIQQWAAKNGDQLKAMGKSLNIVGIDQLLKTIKGIPKGLSDEDMGKALTAADILAEGTKGTVPTEGGFMNSLTRRLGTVFRTFSDKNTSTPRPASDKPAVDEGQ